VKRGINVTFEEDNAGRGYYAVTKKRGKLTIEEVEDALREFADHDYYALIAKAFDEDSSQYFLDIDDGEPQGDYVQCYPVGEIMGLWKD